MPALCSPLNNEQRSVLPVAAKQEFSLEQSSALAWSKTSSIVQVRAGEGFRGGRELSENRERKK